MYGQLGGSVGITGAGLGGELAETARELDALCARVESGSMALPGIDSTTWAGLASWACQLSLALLRREIGAARELLRCAADLSSAAAFEAGQRA